MKNKTEANKCEENGSISTVRRGMSNFAFHQIFETTGDKDSVTIKDPKNEYFA